MEPEQVERAVARKSALIYLPISLGASLLFWLAAMLIGDYPVVARVGGAVWVGLLSLIVTMPLVTARAKRQLKRQPLELTVATADSPADEEAEAIDPSTGSRLSDYAWASGWVAITLLAFAVGLGSGYLLWGRPPAEVQPAAAQTSPLPAEPGQANVPPANPAESTAAQAAPQLNSSQVVSPTILQVTMPWSYTLPARFGKIGPALVAAGGIDYDRFVQLYEQNGQPLTEAQLKILTEGSDEPITIDGNNAYFLLNFFWALGLTNQNRILTEGPMMQGGIEKIGDFASTGGWTLGTKPATELFASAQLITLTKEQQLAVEEVAGMVYRPCCNGPTLFPDCNHGMAMLGMLELLASQGATTTQMLEAAKYLNSFWYPQQSMEVATFFKASQGLDFAQIDGRQMMSMEIFSASGFGKVHQWLGDNGLLPQAPNGGGNNCAA